MSWWESAITGSVFILPLPHCKTPMPNTETDSLADFLPTQQWCWGEKCVFYQAESSTKALGACAKRRNNEAKKGAINFSLCWGFRRRRQARIDVALPYCQCSALWYGLVQLATGEVTPVHAEPISSCLKSKEVYVRVHENTRVMLTCCNYSHHTAKTGLQNVDCQTLNS